MTQNRASIARADIEAPRFVWEEDELEIIGSVDSRRCVRNTTAVPFRHICQLDRPHPSACSGTLIGPRTVLTAGHCLDDGHVRMRVIPGRNDFLSGRRQRPFGTARAAGVVFGPGFNPVTGSGVGTREDYGVAILRDPIGQRSGWWSFDRRNGLSVLAADRDLPRPGSTRIHVAGYPCDHPKATHRGGARDRCFRPGITRGTVPYHAAGGLARVGGGIVEYTTDTFGCQSGSPVWFESRSRGRVLVGVHITGDASGGPVANRGVLISGRVRDFVRAHAFWPMSATPPAKPQLRRGARGAQVRELQYRLNVFNISRGRTALRVDGIFGRRTDAATRSFQRAFRLAVDGIVGRRTWTRIQRAF